MNAKTDSASEAAPKIPERIVAEVCRNWSQGLHCGDTLLSQRFERVIKINAERGYDLESWRFQTVFTPPIECKHNSYPVAPYINETIIAIFIKR